LNRATGVPDHVLTPTGILEVCCRITFENDAVYPESPGK
jgi:hypothetical protein